MPTPKDVRFFETPQQLRAWFEANHDTAAELWVGYHRKRSGRPSITWQDLVDQELCFGWIDSVRYSLGDNQSAQRITPRRKGSVWSAVNVRRFHELEEQGLVHPSGRAAFDKLDPKRSGIYSFENRDQGFNENQLAAFQKHKRAWIFFETQAPSYKRIAAYWVVSAKREETRERRLRTLIEHSKKGERLPQLTSPARRPR